MKYITSLLLILTFMTNSLFAEETEIQLNLTANNYQNHITRSAKQGYSLLDASVYPGKKGDRFAALSIRRRNQKERKSHHGLTKQKLDDKVKQYAAEGFQPVAISGYEKKGTSRFAVIWEKLDQADHILKHSLTDQQLQTTLEELKQQGYAPVKMDGYTLKKQPMHAGIWAKQTKIAWEATCNIPITDFPKVLSDFASRGFRLSDLCGFTVNEKPFYHALWLKETDPAWIAQFHLSLADFHKTVKKMKADKYQLANIDGYRVNNKPYFTTIWEQPEPNQELSLPTWNTADEIPISGLDQKELSSLDTSIKEFLLEHHPPGASIAVSYRGRLVYARGFGYADKELKQVVQPDNMFRIASISKPITAVAIMKLIEQKKLSLDSKVFDILKDYQKQLAEQGVDSRLKEITVRQLLHHTAGWDRSVSFDPMFRSVYFAKQLGKTPPAEIEDIIQMMIKQPLDFNPGERYAYSNFGYCLLGRIIEAVTRHPYQQYVEEVVFTPLHITNTKMGKTLLKHRRQNEVKYYSPSLGTSVFDQNYPKRVPSPYGAWYLEAMDSHGAWIASAPDLVRFAAAFDRIDQCPILKAPTISQMFERPSGLAGYDANGNPKVAYYACGWMVRPIDSAGNANHWHAGSLSGTSTLLVRRLDRINWAILFNTRNGKDQKRLSSLIDGPMHEWIDQIKHWPEKDQFTINE
ncbi:serine hydrolase [Gimesia aquarii]|uniref:Penicillin-binding protein 4 n=1 Tax=Gimesia aquarii TaxID=2527964 RepID=A0A517VZU7_9PLAN|nr:serine hydrolase [Gimesia aquarii]QDT98534.1 Penicillin-binding protein 4* [Gimesia aquarii]